MAALTIFMVVLMEVYCCPFKNNILFTLTNPNGHRSQAIGSWSTIILVPPLHFQSGGVAGLTVDLMLFPMDTVKTRLQSRQGFLKAGGFQKIYAGVGPAAAGSIPSGTEQHEYPCCCYISIPCCSYAFFYSMLLLHFHSLLLLFCSGSVFLYLRVGEDMPLPEGAQAFPPSAPHICSVNG